MEKHPNLKEEVGGSIPGFEISSLLDKTLPGGQTASCALALACQSSVLKKRKKKRRELKNYLFEVLTLDFTERNLG